MKLIELKCPSCGANLTINRDLETCTCNYCGASILVDEEIIKVEHIVKDSKITDLHEKIDGYFKLDDYDKVIYYFNELMDKYSYDADTWLYAIKIETNNYNEDSIDIDKINEYLDKYKLLEKDNKKKIANVKMVEDYIDKMIEKFEDIDEELYCPYCDERVFFGDKRCKHCGEELWWPSV